MNSKILLLPEDWMYSKQLMNMSNKRIIEILELGFKSKDMIHLRPIINRIGPDGNRISSPPKTERKTWFRRKYK